MITIYIFELVEKLVDKAHDHNVSLNVPDNGSEKSKY